MATIESIKDISKYELRDIIDAMKNQLVHLERSQVELQYALAEQPDDADYQQAYDENVVNIQVKKNKIKEFKDYLKEIDMAYYVQHYAKDVVEQQPTPPTPPAPPITAVVDNSDGGVFL